MTESSSLVGQWRRTAANRVLHLITSQTSENVNLACGWSSSWRGTSVPIPYLKGDEPDRGRCGECQKKAGLDVQITGGRVRGHGLISEGAPHNSAGYRIGHSFMSYGRGHAKCQCGAMSEELPSAAARRRWHRDHKAAVRQP